MRKRPTLLMTSYILLIAACGGGSSSNDLTSDTAPLSDTGNNVVESNDTENGIVASDVAVTDVAVNTVVENTVVETAVVEATVAETTGISPATYTSSSDQPLQVVDVVSTIDSESQTLMTRLGITVAVSEDTEIVSSTGENLAFDALQVGDFVEASAIAGSGSGLQWASIILNGDDSQYCEITGPIEGVSDDQSQFRVGRVTVEINDEEESVFTDGSGNVFNLSGFMGQLSNGAQVRVRSDLSGAGCNEALLMASNGSVTLDRSVIGFSQASAVTSLGMEGEAIEEEGLIETSIETSTETSANEVTESSRVVSIRLRAPIEDINGNTITLGGRQVTVTEETLIDARLIGSADEVDIDQETQRFGDLGQALSDLLPLGMSVEMDLAENGSVLLITP